MVALNRAVAVAMTDGPQVGLDLIADLERDQRVAADHRMFAVRGHLLELLGDLAGARVTYQAAAVRTTSLPQQRYLNGKLARLR